MRVRAGFCLPTAVACLGQGPEADDLDVHRQILGHPSSSFFSWTLPGGAYCAVGESLALAKNEAGMSTLLQQLAIFSSGYSEQSHIWFWLFANLALPDLQRDWRQQQLARGPQQGPSYHYCSRDIAKRRFSRQFFRQAKKHLLISLRHSRNAFIFSQSVHWDIFFRWKYCLGHFWQEKCGLGLWKVSRSTLSTNKTCDIQALSFLKLWL